MNGAEQQARHTAVTALQIQIDDHALLLEALDTRIVAVAQLCAAGDAALDRAVARLQTRLDTLERSVGQLQAHPVVNARTCWQRLRWIAVGR
jgi:hypothetical protein